MKNFAVYIVFAFFFTFYQYGKATSFITPTEIFDVNFSNFPLAWTKSKGQEVVIGILDNNDFPILKGKIKVLCPNSKIVRIEYSDFIQASSITINCNVIIVNKELHDISSKIEKLIRNYINKGIIVIFSAYYGKMDQKKDYGKWIKFITKISHYGAIIVGVHGRAYQIGNINFWKKVPIDVFALNTDINNDNDFKSFSLLDVNLESSNYLVGGALALFKSAKPNISPYDAKKALKLKGKKLLWITSGRNINKNEWNSEPILSSMDFDKYKKELIKEGLRVFETFEGTCLDAALILDQSPSGDGDWCLNELEVKSAQKMSTGKNIVVAILDHSFYMKDKSLINRIFQAGSIYNQSEIFSDHIGHGTWMARYLIRVAPDVKIMPVNIWNDKDSVDADNFIRGIDYAIDNGANIISISHNAISDKYQNDFDKAVQRAVNKSICVVYIHYNGNRRDVINPRPIEFSSVEDPSKYVFLIGTNFNNELSFPYTWGLSQTAPIVSGIIALMKEIKPRITPFEVTQILGKSYRDIGHGKKLLDARIALVNTIKFNKSER